MMKKFKPRTFSPEEFNAVSVASAEQDGSNRAPKSGDPINYPVFEVPVNEKKLIYVPNITRTKPDGSVDLAMDEGAFHRIIAGRSTVFKRCYSGIVTNGYTGECPLCDCVGEAWDLFNIEWEQLCKQKGVDPSEREADPLKEDRKKLLNKMAISKAEKFVTFPIAVIACEEGKLKPKLKEDGTLDYEFMWYTCKDRTVYQAKWIKGIANYTDDEGECPTNPAGLWCILDFTYTPKENGKHDKMGSANALQVSVKTMKGFDEVSKQLDQDCLAKGWTVQKASETVIANYYLDLEDVTEMANEAMQETRNKLIIYNTANAPAPAQNIDAPNNSAENAINSFSAQAVTAGIANAGVQAGATPGVDQSATQGVVSPADQGGAPQVPVV
jgi:hypothetical protein